jgi:ribonuclease R
VASRDQLRVPDGARFEVIIVPIGADQASAGGFTKSDAKLHLGHRVHDCLVDVFHSLDEMALTEDEVPVFRDFQANRCQLHEDPYTTSVERADAASLEDRILERMAAMPHGRASRKHLMRDMGVRGDGRQLLDDSLERLTERGALIELRGEQFVLPGFTREFATGKLAMHRDGYGFVVPDVPPPGLRGDIFLPPGTASQAMHGDRVLSRITRVAPDGRAEGEILRILKRAHPTVIGEFRVGPRANYLVPHDTRIQHNILIPGGLEVPPDASQDRIGESTGVISGPDDLDGVIVNVELLEYPSRDQDAVGRVLEVLGRPDDFGVDVEVTIRKHHLPHRFPAAVLEQAQGITGVIRAAEGGARRDFRGLDIVTIDGETARDFDDAVWVDRLAGGTFTLQVHIADVGHFVQPGTPIDREALLRGTSVYFPDRAVPMLPLELSTGVCSLKPGVDRLAMSVLLEIDHRGEIVGQDFCRSLIRSVERMTYTNVHLILEGDPGLRERYGSLAKRFEQMRELALILNRKRVRRGSIDFDLPEPLIQFDSEGLMTGIARTERTIAHRIIEEFMLAANEAVAAHLENAGIESIYRIHEPPEASRVLEFEEVAARFGYTLGIGAMPVKRFAIVDRQKDGKIRRDVVRADERFTITSRHYQKLVSRLEGKPEERILSYLMLRSLRQARYSVRNSGHFALAAKTYTHFTSPIRRYPDLLVHRLLGGLLDGTRAPIPDLAAMADSCSDTERRAAEAERDLVEWKKIKFMIDRVGDEFPALIISTTRFGFFVELDELFVEGLVPLEALPGERFAYQENVRKIVGQRTRREFVIGDKVTVRLDRVDGVEKKLSFSLAEPEKERRPKKGRKKT